VAHRSKRWRRGSSRLVDDFNVLVAGRPRGDRHDLLRRLRQTAPIFFSDVLGAWVVSRYVEARAVLEDGRRFAPVTDGPGVAVLGGGFLQWRA
jgi:hypothetical protein